MVDFATQRQTMVDTQVRPADVTRFSIIAAMLEIPREMYVPDALRPVAYSDGDIDFDTGRRILAARTLAKMLEVANVGAGDVVLDLGCGLGYSTAVIAKLADAIVGVEDDEARASDAQTTLSEQGADNAVVMYGDLANGLAQGGPYDLIVAQGGIAAWPDVLTQQLTESGRAVAIWMQGHLGVVRVGEKHNGVMAWRDSFHASAPILPGFEKIKEFAL